MCTLALYFQEFEDYPLIIAANRDEFFSRPSAPPQVLGRDPLILAGKDLLSGGTWLGINENGLLAGILNRRSEKDRENVTVRSRGLLCLDILSVKDPLEACALLEKQKHSFYQPFNLLFADAQHAYVAYNQREKISWIKLEKGLHVLSNTFVYDTRSEKLNHAYLLFSRAREGSLREWDRPSWVRTLKTMLSDHSFGQSDPKDAICVHTESYGTVSSTIIFYSRAERRFYSYFAPGPPCREGYGESMPVEVR